MKKGIMERIKTFADVCAETGKNADDYVVPLDATDEERAAIYMRRLKLIAKCFNGKKKVRLADTKQWKHYPWFNIIPDSSRPAGFRLSYGDFVFGRSISRLGVRPAFLEEEHAEYVGTQFIEEYEAHAQYEELSNH
jgi:hypothetical protein